MKTLETNVALEIKDLVKYYNSFKALDGISFSVHKGEFFGFLGPNGAGKTTTISIITGLCNLTSGSVTVFGKDVVKDYREARRLIGLSPQDFNFDPFLSAREVLLFQAGYYGVPSAKRKQRAAELLQLFGLEEVYKQDYRRLSGGQKRRLSLARALMHEPPILILDEPTAGIDLELRYFLWEFLKELNKKGTTILLTTHYIEEAEKLCDRIGVIHNGRIEKVEDKDKMIRSMAKDTIQVRIEPRDAELPWLKDYRHKVHNGTGLITFYENKESLGKVLKHFYDSGVEVVDLQIEETTLEDVFVRLTTKKES